LAILGALGSAGIGSTLTACDDTTEDAFTIRPIPQVPNYGCSTTAVPCTNDKLCCSRKCEASGVCAAPADASADASTDTPDASTDASTDSGGDAGDGG
jgi:hypothetical protein